MKIKSINPYTEEVNWTYDSFPFGGCKALIEKSRTIFSLWSSLPAEEREKSFSRVAEILRQNSDIYAGVITVKDEDETVKIANSTEYGGLG